MAADIDDRIPDEVEKISKACREHARDLLRGALRLKEENLPHLAFHLAVLALEEIGKAGLVVVGHIAQKHEDGAWPGKHASDHIKKLFWAIWGPTLGVERTTKEQI